MRLTFTMKDIIARQNMNLSVGFSVADDWQVEVSGGYIVASNGRDGEGFTKFDDTIKRVGEWSVGSSVSYLNSAICTASAGFTDS